ncbi:uncharacterized protein DUF3857 [Lutibacter oceani]|uniref:Uncharacterized protein DUF3857 n=1 Tax=Lutibacter oceani TaxID=1853311 RepID=A0A3D9RYZ3_9FLAO|nr:DUF3857 domain-containing protein [Lutibacter oceani]REE81865.1 uncharacterized protein DUF3857 [Lutibacter oceani]
MKKIASLFILITTIITSAQNKSTNNFGITSKELNLKIYEKDSTANALVLFESGNSEFKEDRYNIIIRTKYYYKIKIFNRDGYKNASFSIPLYNNKNNFDKIKDIKAVTHNLKENTPLEKDQIFEEKVNENWKLVKFTMPNLTEGCIIEVSYTIETPFKFNLTGWEFQSDIPKLFSQFKASIPGNYVYNRQLKGYLKLKTNSSTIKKNCFRVTGFSGHSDCEEVVYEMENIPAFEEEDYMTDTDNFLAKIKFELSETKWFDGKVYKYTKTWGDVDKEFKKDKNIGTQIKKANYFKDKLPIEITSLPSEIEKAKSIYYFIQNHFKWNEKYSIFKNVNVKNAFEKKTGNVGEINISLINALKLANLNAELVVLSVRNNGFATKLYPVISDFNYLIAKVNIDGTYFLLDATEKLLPFGLLPFRCLNGYGRVMDFEKDSYWIDIKPNEKNITNLTALLELKEDGTIIGKIRKYYSGYNAFLRREKSFSLQEDDLISEFESSFTDLEVINYEIINKDEKEKPLIENFEVKIENLDNVNTIYFNPFFDEKFSKNPFKQKNRLYPVDFGYPRQFSTNFSLEVPDNFNIESFPKNKSIALNDNGGNFSLLIRKNQNFKITMKSDFKIKKPIYFNVEYYLLKELFNQVINSQKTPIILKKI